MARLRIAVVAGEASGDQLGASLLQALAERGIGCDVMGVGGPALTARGLTSLFPQSDIAVMGLGPVIRRLPLLLRRIRETADAILEARPDILVTIDAPDFTKRVARRVHRQAPDIPIVHWVCPSVWAWRPGRAPAMRGYIDHILCLLPFEPEALAQLNGPPGSFVGHPLEERIPQMRPQTAEEAAARRNLEAPRILILPGSRNSEVRRLLPVFLETARRVRLVTPGAYFTIPTMPWLEAGVREAVAASGLDIAVTVSDDAKWQALRSARCALAASGTVTLELAFAGIPLVAAYRVANWEAAIARRLIKLPSVILPNLVLGDNIVPEFLQGEANPDVLLAHLTPLIQGRAAYDAQIAGFSRLEAIMAMPGSNPSARAASLVLDLAGKARDRRMREQAP
jgi:lipid-A-disaccharide synthase